MKQHQQGFTLIEMLIALVVLALAMAAVNGGLSFAARALSSASHRTEIINDQAMGASVVQRLLEKTYPLVVLPIDSDQPQLLFDGRDDKLRTAAFLPGYVSESGLYGLVFEIERDGPGSVLTLSRGILDRSETPVRWPSREDPSVILRSDGQLSWAYLADDTGDGEPSWDEELALPTAIQLTEEHNGERVLLTVRLPTQANWPCSTEALIFCPLEEVFP